MHFGQLRMREALIASAQVEEKARSMTKEKVGRGGDEPATACTPSARRSLSASSQVYGTCPSCSRWLLSVVKRGEKEDNGRKEEARRTFLHFLQLVLRQSSLSQRKRRSFGFSMRQTYGQNLRRTDQLVQPQLLAARGPKERRKSGSGRTERTGTTRSPLSPQTPC